MTVITPVHWHVSSGTETALAKSVYAHQVTVMILSRPVHLQKRTVTDVFRVEMWRIPDHLSARGGLKVV